MSIETIAGMQPKLAAAVLVAALLAGRETRAEGLQGLRGELSLGGSMTNSLRVAQSTFDAEVGHGGVTLGASLGWRSGDLVVGVNGDHTSTLFNQNESFLGGHGGWAADNDHGEVEVVGEMGVHFLTSLGADFLTETDGPTATLPYAGLRVGGLLRGGDHPARLGGWIFVRADLGRTTAVANTSVFTDSNTIHYDVGGYTAGFALRLQFGR